MTYDQLIEKVRLKALGLLKTNQLMSPIVYDAINDAAREVANKARFTTKTATLSIVAGTVDYDIASTIAADVGEIYQIQIPTGEIVGKSVDEFEDLKLAGTISTPEYYEL
jgi:hypothetical protein